MSKLHSQKAMLRKVLTLSTVILVIMGSISIMQIGNASAEQKVREYFPTSSVGLTRSPTYCIIKPPSEIVPEHMAEGYVNRFIGAVSEWSDKLIAEDPKNRNNWMMHITYEHEHIIANDPECDITVRIQVSSVDGAAGRYCPVNSDIYFPDECPKPPIENKPFIVMYVKSWENYHTDDIFFNIAKHELGHSIGLGHYISGNEKLNQKWATTDPAPSVMIPTLHQIPELQTITQIDIETVMSIYGERGFFAFAPTQESQTSNPRSHASGLFDYINISENKILRPTNSGNNVMLTLSGQISKSEFEKGNNVYLFVHNELKTFVLELTPTRNGYFQAPLIIDKSYPTGEYTIEGVYQNKQDMNNNIFFQVIDSKI